MSRTRVAIAWSIAAGLLAPIAAGAESEYLKPPKAILDVLHAPLPPNAWIAPSHDALILAEPIRYPPIADLAQPMLRMAGIRFEPKNRSLHTAPYWSSYDVVRIADGATQHVALPAGAKVSWPRFTTDGLHFAFTNTTLDAVELWLGDTATAQVHRVPGVQLNAFFNGEVRWMTDQKTLLVEAVPPHQGAAPAQPAAPKGPDVQETTAAKGAISTYEVQDVLKNAHDEDLYDYYATSQLELVDAASGAVTPIGKPGIYSELSRSPDGKHLLVTTEHRPYSYLTTHERFPHEVDVWSTQGVPEHHLATLPLADHVPIWGVATGPREFSWRPTEPATLIWAEALDGGDWKTQVPHRDRVLLSKAPFTLAAVEVAQLTARYSGFQWGETGGWAFLSDVDPIKHWLHTYRVQVDTTAAPELIWERSTDERYKNPGNPILKQLPNGAWVIEQDGDAIYLSGTGGSPEGDRPFLDRFDLKTLKSRRLFRSGKDEFESFASWVDRPRGQFLTRHESPLDPPNYVVRTLVAQRLEVPEGEAIHPSTSRAVTHLPDTAPSVRGITKRLVKYQRADGLDLSFTLYLPPGYKEGTRLPAIVWAYPLDFADASVAGQVAGSPQHFTVLGWPLQLFFLLEGYAVIDNPSLPVVGDANKIYDTYMEQLVSGAQAAVDKAVELGVVDRERIGVMGHSHGGLMTVNLLAHSDLFRAGVARSGAYNRSLTAFGFQNERRTLWEAPEVYAKVSPYFHADLIKSPVLLIHGEADYNPGTVPLQSELLYEAIRGTGGTARLVMLPFESHGYTAMESIEDVLAEMLTWFDRYVKNAPPRAAAAQPKK